MKKNETEYDNRIKKKVLLWKEFLITFFILSVLSAGQAMILSAFVLDFENVPPGFIFGMVGYWAIVAAIFSIVNHAQIRKKFDLPMRRLGKAAKEVAEGDFSVYLVPVHTADKANYMDVMFEDFNKMVEKLGSIETLRSDFIANVSHEIRTPLAIIENYATMLQKDSVTPEKQKEYIDNIITASKKLNLLVTNVLKLNQLENGRQVVLEKPFDLCRQICDCILRFEEQWEAKNLNFIIDVEDRLIVTSDEYLTEIIWSNLISNAIKFIESGGTITVKQISDRNSVTISVADTGRGMSKDVMENIFDKFYQGDASHSDEGNGLGLALVRQAIKLLDGTITVASKPGKGSVFTVKLKM